MKFSHRALSLGLLSLASITSRFHLASAAIGFSPPDGEDTNKYLAKFTSEEALASFLDTGVQTVGGIPQLNAAVLEFDSEEEAHEWAADRTDIQWLEKDELVYPASAGAAETTAAEETPYGINMVNAMDIPDYVENSGIKMCIIDSGYAVGHEDLPNPNLGAPITGKGDMCGTPCPWDEDTIRHGTHVAGTILALGDNNKGVIGVVKTGKMPTHIVRVFDTGGTSRSNVINAMYNCVDEGANVVNMSLGGSGASGYDTAVADILSQNERILFVAAAGNGGNNSYLYPASITGVVSVASVTSSKVRSSFSQFNDEVDIAAPGSSVKSTVPNNGYSNFSGTSMASPHVAGVAAKIWSHDPNMTAQQVRNLLESTAEDQGDTGRDDYYGHGIVDAKAAFDKLGPAPPSTSPSPTLAPTSPIPSTLPTLPPTSSPTNSFAPSSIPSTSPSEHCPNKKALMKWKTKKVNCKWAKNKNKCGHAKVKTFCTQTCGTCEHKCDDTTMSFYLKRKSTVLWWCKKLAKLGPNQKAKKCAFPKFQSLCPQTCEVEECMVEDVLIDFDEGSAEIAAYYRDDIKFENWWYQRGKERNPNTGFEYGIVSEPMCAFNGYAREMVMSCPGGSFNLKSLYLTAGRNANVITLTGSDVSGGSISTNINASVTNKQFVELDGFDNLSSVVVSTSQDFAIVDDMTIQIVSPCTFSNDPVPESAGPADKAI